MHVGKGQKDQVQLQEISNGDLRVVGAVEVLLKLTHSGEKAENQPVAWLMKAGMYTGPLQVYNV